MSGRLPELATARLRLRPFREDDLADYARITADPEVMRYIGGGAPLSRDEAWRSLAYLLGHWELRGFGLWAAEERSSGALVGRIGLYRPEGWPGLEVGWLLDRRHWGRGLASEGGEAALHHAFRALGAKRVISLIQPEDAASIRVAVRLGERLESTTEISGKSVCVYAIDAVGFAARRPGAAP